MKTTTYGPLTIFDAHAHLFSRSFVERLGMQAGIAEQSAETVCRRLKWDLPPEDPAELGRRWIEELDAHGVDRSVLFHTLPGDVPSVAKAIAVGPDRLVGYAMIHPNLPEHVDALHQAVEEFSFRGVLLFPSLLQFELTSPAVRGVFGYAHERRLVVVVHCGFLKVGFRDALGLPAEYDLTRGNPLHLQPLAVRYPNATIIIPHLGSGYLRELLMLADMCPNVCTDTSGIGSWARHLPGRPSPADVLGQVLEVLGPERVVFGSDSSFFPRGWREDVYTRQLQVFEELKLSAETVAKIVGGNLQRILS